VKILTLVLVSACLSCAQERPSDPKYAELAAKLFAAEDEARDALLKTNQNDTGPALVKAMNVLAGQALDGRKVDQAFQMYTVTCAVAKGIGDTRGLGLCTRGRGFCYRQMNRLDDALRTLDEATGISLAAGDHSGASAALNAAAVVLQRRGQRKEELAYLQRALDEADVSGEEIAVAQTNMNLGNTYKLMGRYAQAIQAFERSMEFTQRMKLDRQTARLLNNLGSTAFEQHDLEVALSYLERSLAMKEAGGDAAEIVTTLVNLGTLHKSLGQYDKAVAEFRRVSDLAEKAGEMDPRALAIYNWGVALRDQGKLEEAKERLRASLAIAAKSGNCRVATNCTITLAEIAVDQGKPAEGLAMVEPLEAKARAAEDLPTLGSRSSGAGWRKM
jgi:tetratricopeptide (TPR) repeat protein